MNKLGLFGIAMLCMINGGTALEQNQLNGPGNLVITGKDNVAKGKYNRFRGSNNDV